MDYNNFSDKKRDLIRKDILDIKEIQRDYIDLVFIFSKVDFDVKSGKDSWKNYITYFVYSPIKEVLNICKQVHKIHNPTYGSLNEIKQINEYGYSYTNTFDGKSPENDNMLDTISKEIFIFFITDYKLFGNEIIEFYQLKLDLGLIYDSSSLIPTTRFKEILDKWNFAGGIENISYLKHNYYEKMLKISNKKVPDKTEIHKLKNYEQIMWLKYMFEKDFLYKKYL